MKAIDKYLKVVSVFFAALILFQGCTVYKSAPVTLDEALKSSTKVRVKTFDNQTLKFYRMKVLNNKIFGIKINNGERSKTLIEKDNIEKIQLKDKTTSTILSIVTPVVVIAGILVIIVANSLNNMSIDLSN